MQARADIQKVLDRARSENRHLLEPEAYLVLEQAGLEMPRYKWARALPEAREMLERMNAPVAMKVVSSGILHKSDVGGVRLNVETAEGVEQAWREFETIAAKLGVPFQGALVVQQVKAGMEMIVGGMRDEEFGPVAMVGPGGVLVEILRSPTFFVAPVEAEKVATELGSGTLGRLLGGERGRRALDTSSLAAAVSRVSVLMAEFPQISEIDLNPVVVYPDGLAVLDARMMLAV